MNIDADLKHSEENNSKLDLLINQINKIDQIGLKKYYPLISKIINKYQCVYQNNPESKYNEGNVRGHVFELYITNILIEIALNSNLMEWLIPVTNGINITPEKPPLDKKQKKAVKKTFQEQKRDRFNYGIEGDICIFRGTCRIAEYDGFLKIDGNIYLIEMKSLYGVTRPDWDSLKTRINKLAGCFNLKPKVLLIYDKTTQKNYNSSTIEVIPVPISNFQNFWHDFIKNRITWNKIDPISQKLKDPQFLLPNLIDYDSKEQELRDYFLNPIISAELFWKDQYLNACVIEKLPLGEVTDEVFAEFGISSDYAPILYYLSFDNYDINHEFIGFEGKKPIKWKIDPTKKIILSRKKIKPQSHRFTEIKLYVNTCSQKISHKEFSDIINRCRILLKINA
jgi:hypothetical protein